MDPANPKISYGIFINKLKKKIFLPAIQVKKKVQINLQRSKFCNFCRIWSTKDEKVGTTFPSGTEEVLPGTTLKATSAQNVIMLTGLNYITVIPADPSAGACVPRCSCTCSSSSKVAGSQSSTGP